jgi:hypothetical protein
MKEIEGNDQGGKRVPGAGCQVLEQVEESKSRKVEEWKNSSTSQLLNPSTSLWSAHCCDMRGKRRRPAEQVCANPAANAI